MRSVDFESIMNGSQLSWITLKFSESMDKQMKCSELSSNYKTSIQLEERKHKFFVNS